MNAGFGVSYGTSLLHPTPEQRENFRRTAERFMREEISRIDPALANNIVVDMAIDGLVRANDQLGECTASINYADPLATEYQGTFAAPQADLGEVVDRVDALRLAYEAAVGVDWARGQDTTVVQTRDGATIVTDPPYDYMAENGGFRAGELAVLHGPTGGHRTSFSALAALRAGLRPKATPPEPLHPFVRALLDARKTEDPFRWYYREGSAL